MAAVACIQPWGVDSVVIPLSPNELEKMPSFLICELANSPQLVKDVSGACCLARMGFRLFANITQEKKEELCHYLCRQGLTNSTHQSTLSGSRKDHLRTQDARERDPALQDSCYFASCLRDEGTFSGHVLIFLIPTTSMFSTMKIRLG